MGYRAEIFKQLAGDLVAHGVAQIEQDVRPGGQCARPGGGYRPRKLCTAAQRLAGGVCLGGEGFPTPAHHGQADVGAVEFGEQFQGKSGVRMPGYRVPQKTQSSGPTPRLGS